MSKLTSIHIGQLPCSIRFLQALLTSRKRKIYRSIKDNVPIVSADDLPEFVIIEAYT